MKMLACWILRSWPCLADGVEAGYFAKVSCISLSGVML